MKVLNLNEADIEKENKLAIKKEDNDFRKGDKFHLDTVNNKII